VDGDGLVSLDEFLTVVNGGHHHSHHNTPPAGGLSEKKAVHVFRKYRHTNCRTCDDCFWPRVND